jgi:predicted outer membrane repeat protein
MVFVLLFSLVAAAAVWTETSEVQAQPNIWYVDSFKMISGDGESWGTAFKTLQEAIDTATGSDEIWVRAGTYEISSPIVLDLWDDEAIYGGFAGWETSRDQRNWKNNKTIIDGKHNLADSLIKIFETAPTIDGFTITGAGTGVAGSGGSAMSVFGCGGFTPYINNCTFVDNWAHGWDRGGAMTIHSSSPRVTNCVFYGNRSDYWGGAIFNRASSSPIITNCTFSGNHAQSGGGAMANSAHLDYIPYPELVNCILWGDTATSGAAEIHGETASWKHYNNDINQSGYAGGNGNIRQDPLFRSASGNIGLRPGSPCIDTGTNTATFKLLTDYEGDPRIIDGDENGTDIIDIGADEFDPNALFGVWYVNDAVGSSGDGTSWGIAFKTIGEATGGALSGEEVWVAQGTYNLTGQINVPTGIGIYGGFAGGETNWGQRDWMNNVTTVNGQNAVGTLFHVGSGATGEVTIDGFTITGATSYAILKQNDQALLTVENCIITGNTGIGLVSYYFNTTVNNCTFSDNTGLNYAGAAIKHTNSQPDPSTLIISNSTFTHNRTLHSEQGDGGAIAIVYSTVNMSNCTFSDNSSVRTGGAIYNDTSAAYTVTINDCTFSGNTSGHDPNFIGGAIYSNGPLIINGGEFTGNEAGTYGGAIHCNAPLTANGVTFSGNHGLGRNAIDCTSTTTLTDCQFIGNTPSGTGVHWLERCS